MTRTIREMWSLVLRDIFALRKEDTDNSGLFLDAAEIHVFGKNIILLATRDVLSFALVYPDSFPAESTCVSFWSAQCELCGCCCSAQRVLCESCRAHQVLVFPFPCCCVISFCARLCVLDSRHGMHHGSIKSHVSILSRMVAEPVFVWVYLWKHG